MFFTPKSNKRARGTGIVKVSTLFDKYKKTLRAPQKTVITHFVSIVSDILDTHSLSEAQCAYSPNSRIISVRVSGMIKTEIQFKKKQILARLQEELGEKNSPTDIL